MHGWMQRCCAVHTAATSYQRLAANSIETVNTAEQLAMLHVHAFLLKQKRCQMKRHTVTKALSLQTYRALLDTLQPGGLELHLVCT